MGSGFFENMSHGHKAREQRREARRRDESADYYIGKSVADATRCLSIAEEALANNDSRTAQLFAQRGNDAATLAGNIRVAKLMGRW